MTSIPGLRLRSATVAAALVLAAGCSSSESTSTDTSDAPGTSESAETVADAEPAPTVSDAEPAETVADAEPAETTPAPAPEPDAAPAGSGDISIVLADGRTWTLDADLCIFDPDATGPAAAVINIAGSNPDGVELNVLEAWPLDGSTDTGTAFIANFVDENEELFLLVEGSAAMVGDAVEITADYYNDVFYQDGDTPDGSAVVSCTP